ncbi:MAG TPA: hypothetical protein PK544_04735 [Spirochaetota bacterium]|nr:hypothetical protein [Spirochaetota bacterium]
MRKTMHFLQINTISISFLMLVLVSAPLTAQSIIFDTGLSEKAVKGISNISSSLIADSFTPMTHYGAGDWTISLIPAYFSVDRAFDDPDLRGDDLRGWAAGLGGGYAISDSLMAYTIFSAMKIQGTIEAVDYSNYTFDTAFSLYTLNAGLGYDLISGRSTWSIPLYFGGSIQRYSADIDLSPIPGAYVDPMNVTLTGDGFLYALTAGFAISKEFFGRVRVTPYFLYLYSFNSADITAHATQTVTIPIPGTISRDFDLSIDRINAKMIGLTATLLSEKSWSISASIGGILTSSTGWYNEHFLDGLKMKSIVIAASYRGGTE